MICGLAHTFSVSERFRSAGFEVEVRVFRILLRSLVAGILFAKFVNYQQQLLEGDRQKLWVNRAD